MFPKTLGMKVFVYESITATIPASDSSLYREGLAMREALTADLAACPGIEVVSFHPGDSFENGVTLCDAVWLIAPELGDTLGQLAEQVLAKGKALIGSNPAAIRATSDKLDLADRWKRRGLPTPETCPASEWRQLPFPLVIKPVDGCGSTATFLARNETEVRHALERCEKEGFVHEGLIAQPLIPGLAASVSFLAGESHLTPLLPAIQNVSPGSNFAYAGGSIPLPREFAERAVRLGQQALEPVEGVRGYVGVDLILGDAIDGSKDMVIEINPRLTTSYVGLRALASFNLAQAALDLCLRNVIPLPRWKDGRIQFTPDGLVTWL
ncbi:MAG: ATP-grasp domain-containing protein [Gemmataceae bacterium]